VNALLFILAMSTWTLGSMVPSRAFLTYYIAVYVHETHSGSTDDTVLWLGFASNVMMRINPIVNPFLTAYICAPYRRECARLFTGIKSAILRRCRVVTP
ncbi:hypothetical protein AAVH_26783, partial [Aphelenchoides avenae]